MDISIMKDRDSSQSVRVAVNVRPLITPELMIGCTDCISIVPGEPQVQIGSHAFTFDYVYGSGGLPNPTIFKDCVAPLVDSLFDGFNATVLAYGQTGSGKTYTMGTNYTDDAGIIPKVMDTIFKRVDTLKSSEFLIRVSFIEIFNEEVFDLLDPNSPILSKTDKSAPARIPIQIRETVNGGITLAGVTEAEVTTKEEMASYLSRGSLSRATGSTNMNSQSSRSHAIFTISMEQKRIGVTTEDMGDDILSAKLHLVDLAGSERAKRTGADGMRFKEGIHINKGLLALGNVISALGDEKKRKDGGHVPYRDSKLTRLLQDSLGGNSKTVMIACVSPADSNAEETLNTLKYANRARNIQNKAVVNRDPIASQMQRMRSQIEQLQAEVIFLRGDAGIPIEQLEIFKKKISLLEESNAELQDELKERRITCGHLAQRAVDAQVEKDKVILKFVSERSGKALDENFDQDIDLMRNYVAKIQGLEGELLRLQVLNSSKSSEFVDDINLDDDGLHIKDSPSVYEPKALDFSDDSEDNEKELEHLSNQEKLDRELKELDKKLEQKEAEMSQFASVNNTSVLKQHYEKKVFELEQEKKALQKEIEELKHNLSNISSSSDDGTQKLKQDYLQKLNALEAQVSELKKKQNAQSQILRQKQKSDEAAKKLQDEIQRIKSHKVQLQQKAKHESEQFRLWKASREKEVLQLKKEGRRNEYEMHKLLALNQRQKMVLQRKTEEASMATKRLKDLLEARKVSSRETYGAGKGPGVQALTQAIEHELEVTVRVHEVRCEYEHQMEERARMANELARLKEEAEMMKHQDLSCLETMSPGARNSRLFALENMLSTSSSTLVSMASQLSEAEERERVFSGRGRWNQVRTLAEAKNVMNYLFNLASTSRCQLRDKEVDCRERDSQVRELKEKVVKLSCYVRQLQMQMQKLEYDRREISSLDFNSKDGHVYNLRQGRNSIMSAGDMDTSDSEISDEDYVVSEAETDTDKVPTKKRNASCSDFKPPGGSGMCCTCSKVSLCKTTKCQCLATWGICGDSCGCLPTRCTNRGTLSVKEEPSSEEGALVSQGAMLLQGAFSENPDEEQDAPKRKPLSDIGNAMEKPNVPKPPQKKKWKKSIKLVPIAPPDDTTEGFRKADDDSTEAELPVKLPRAMRSAALNGNNLLTEKNSEPTESVSNVDTFDSSQHPRQSKTLDEKENCRN